MSTEKEQNQTNENQFRLQKYVWWPWSTKVRGIAIAIVTLAFFLGTTIRTERHLVGDKKEGDNIQRLVDWMKSPESQNKSMNLRCQKVNDELRCTRQPEEGNGHAENSKQSQWFFLRLDDLKGDQNQSENSLCCRPCGHSPSNDSTETTEDAGGNTVENCKYYSVTLSEKFEYELKRMLKHELQLLQKNTEFQTLLTECKTNLFETKFHNLLNETLKEVSLEKPTHSTEQQVVYDQNHSTTTSKAFDIPVDKIKSPTNFTLSQENLNNTLAVFQANKSVADVAQEVFHATTLNSSVRSSAHTPSFLLALVPMSRGSCSAASRTSATCNISIEDHAIEKSRNSTSVEVGSPLSVDKRKEVMENLSSAPDNDLFNATEVNVHSTLASITGMLCSKIFNGVPNVSNPRFLTVICNLACATKQQYACSSRSLETLGDNLKELLLMSLGTFMDIDARNRSLQSFMHCRAKEVQRDENLATTTMCCEDIINLRRQVADLTRQLEELREKVVQSFQSGSTAKSQ